MNGQMHRPSALRRFSESTIGPPALMLAAAALGLLWANLGTGAYESLFHHELRLGGSGWGFDEDLHGWINDGLMTLFFFQVGLEIKRELAIGELQDLRSAALPAIAALGGMLVPAGLYLAVNLTMADGLTDGWAVPVATDIAFTLGVLSLLGSRVPVHLRLFILTLAIVDDIGGIVIIAVAFSDELDLAFLLAMFAALAAMDVTRRAGVATVAAYVPLGVAAWYLAWRAGIEPTIAGVAIGMLTPANPIGGRDVLGQLEHRLVPITAVFVLPVFALANTGIPLSASVISEAATSPVSVGIVVGLVLGKPIGILVASRLAIRTGVGRLHESVPTSLLAPASCMAGIGFTVALFVADLSFEAAPEVLDRAKIGVLTASIFAAVAGYLSFVAAHGRVAEAGESLVSEGT